MSAARAVRAALLALLLAWLGAPTHGEDVNPCADDGCGCLHEGRVSECCCASDELPLLPESAPRDSSAASLSAARVGMAPSTPVLDDLGCRKTRRAVGASRGAPPGVAYLPLVVVELAPRQGFPAPRACDRPPSFEPEPSIPPPRGRRN
jgi:hypothetical protein